jgi:radical SAM protein with 4Fe4S-binding SPASM domain
MADRSSRSVASNGVSLEGTYNSKRVLRDHCGAGLSEVSVDPEGWVYPCRLLQYARFKTDNVRARRLKQIFEDHAILRNIRSTTTKDLNPCKTCIIRNHCGSGCRGIHFSFTHDYIKSHPLFCAYLRSSFELQTWASTGEVPSPRRTGFHRSDQKSVTTNTSTKRIEQCDARGSREDDQKKRVGDC